MSCAACGERIHRFECLWKELEHGTVRECYALDFEDGRRRPRLVWHPACLPHDSERLVASSSHALAA